MCYWQGICKRKKNGKKNLIFHVYFKGKIKKTIFRHEGMRIFKKFFHIYLFPNKHHLFSLIGDLQLKGGLPHLGGSERPGGEKKNNENGNENERRKKKKKKKNRWVPKSNRIIKNGGLLHDFPR